MSVYDRVEGAWVYAPPELLESFAEDLRRAAFELRRVGWHGLANGISAHVHNLDAAAKDWGRHEEVFHEVERLYRMKHDDESFAKAIDVAGRNVLRAAGQLVEDKR